MCPRKKHFLLVSFLILPLTQLVKCVEVGWGKFGLAQEMIKIGKREEKEGESAYGEHLT